MKTDYTPDNTRSSIVVVVSLAIIVSVIAALVGLSDKPQVSSIAIIPGQADVAVEQPASTDTFGFDVSGDEADEPLDDPATSTGVGTADEEPGEPEREIIIVPTAEPTATPEVAAAVEPTPVPAEDDDAADVTSDALPAPALPTSSGTVQGTFFTKGDENEGAVVAQNLITVSFAEDGSGAFQGVLDITYADGTHILLNMSGELEWAATIPQVEATLAGAFTLDAPIATDSINADDAELSISSLQAGSGSLCTTKCFGFTFPPQ